ncbi:MAG: class I SAM-dependent methyltransferase [Haloquadratum sp.]
MDDERRASSARETYDRIAEHFASTRAYPWPEVRAFLTGEAEGDLDDAAERLRGAAAPADRSAPASGRPTDVALDLGCGNGRHAEVLTQVVDAVVGVDVSGRLLRTARKRAAARGFDDSLRAVQADAAALPLRSGTVAVAVYVAALHHLRPRERRVRSLSELNRVLVPDGRALVSAWSTAHDRFEASEGFDTTVDWTLPGGESVPRFYHIYDPGEFAADVRASDLRLLDAVVSSGNCYAVVEGSAAGR